MPPASVLGGIIMTTIKSYTLKNGDKRYQFQIYVGIDPLTGKEQRTTRRGFKTKKEAQLSLARLKLEIENGNFKKEQAETFQEIYDIWMEQYPLTVEASTLRKTLSTFEIHILPSLGRYKIQKINVDVCQKAVNTWASKVKHFVEIKAYAARIFQFAIKRGYAQSNPMLLVETPIVRKKVSDQDEKLENFYPKEELREFLSCLQKDGRYKIYALFRLLAYSGMRMGEAIALTWEDLNFKDNEIRISKSVARGLKAKQYVKTTKSGNSRTIKMDEGTMAILKEWKKYQQIDYLKLGFNTLQPNQLIFSNTKNTYLQPSTIRKWIIRVQEKYNLNEITTHGLRHTHCSLLFEAGASIKEVQDRLGHADAKITMNIYAHVSKKSQEVAVQKFEKFMEN